MFFRSRGSKCALVCSLVGLFIMVMGVFSVCALEVENLVMTTGNPGGTYYYIGAGMSKILSSKISSIEVTTESTTGSPVENGSFTSQSPETMGIITLDGMYAALKGDKKRGFRKSLENIAAIQAGHNLTLYILTLQKSGISSLGELKGKKVGLPTVGNTAYFQTIAILGEYGITLDDIKGTPMTYAEQADALKDGTIDVMIVAGGQPAAAVMDVANTKDIKFLSIDEQKIEGTLSKYPYWWISKMPAGTYKGQDQDVNVIQAQILLIANTELDEDTVYNITKVLNESTEELAAVHKEGANWSLKTTKKVFESGVVPFHPGAVKYYEEVL